MEIPNKLNAYAVLKCPEQMEISQLIEVYFNGELQTHIAEYNIERGYIDKYQLKVHNQGYMQVRSVVTMNERPLINRLFGKVEVKWKS